MLLLLGWFFLPVYKSSGVNGYITLLSVGLHYITLPCVILHYITLNCITLHRVAFDCITLPYLVYTTLHYIITVH